MARKILLADDSVTAQNMGRRILSEAGYEVVTVNNGSAALKKIAENAPDIIILDVYMPGYSGVEVCQRIKQSPETARIPVLLTVGKLEPFKADEARRVKADAHLVKPFEASELLAALTKLEDKIVPQAQPKGRPARNAAAVEPSKKSKDAQFGDSETGWKNRLTIPSPSAKAAEVPEEEKRKPADTAFRTFAHGEDSKAASPPPFTGPVLDTLPQDITADEIAAITAAAEAFSGPGSLSVPDLMAEIAAATQVETSYAPAPSAETVPEISQESVAAAEPAVETQPPAVWDTALAEPSLESQAAVASAPEVEAVAEQTPMDAVADAEVAAALESLAPVNGDQSAGIDAIAAQSVDIAGPRWIAEEIPVSADEAALILEREMQKVYAAMSEMNAPAMDSSLSAQELDGHNGNGNYYTAAQPEVIAAQAESPVSAIVEEQMEPQGVTSDADAIAVAHHEPETIVSEIAAETMVAANEQESISAVEPEAPVVTEAAEAVPSPEAESVWAVASTSDTRHSESEPVPEAAEFLAAAIAETAVAESPADSKAETETSSEKAAYAAAASAHSSFRSISALGSASPAAPVEDAQVAEETASPEINSERETELAAAWAHWRQIRESIGGSQLAQAAQAVSATFNETLPVAPATSSLEPEQASSAASDPSSIASIVESVLAELRPKLVEEITKKMGKEKKK